MFLLLVCLHLLGHVLDEFSTVGLLNGLLQIDQLPTIFDTVRSFMISNTCVGSSNNSSSLSPILFASANLVPDFGRVVWLEL